jgi:hypothetical protein
MADSTRLNLQAVEDIELEQWDAVRIDPERSGKRSPATHLATIVPSCGG